MGESFSFSFNCFCVFWWVEADDRQPKIALKCKDTEELEILAAKARSLNLCARTIQDA
jgi:peptidyl-tRNA hydrolase